MNYKTNQSRLWESIMGMAKIGPGKRGGNKRLALTDSDIEGRKLFIKWANDADCILRLDSMGNIFARRNGKMPKASPILSGSHLDTQPSGGKFDGILGVLGALEVIRSLNDLRIETDRPIEIVVWTNEEGVRFSPAMMGSGVFTGIFVYFFRGTPLLVQMFIIYYGMGQFESIRESFLWIFFREAYWCAIIAFCLNTAGYTAEILRGTIEQTPFGEIEAAKACGMSKTTMYLRIIMPGTFRRALPAYGNEVIFMLHGSALAGVITIVDLFGAAKIVNSRYFVPFESFIAAGLFYLCCTFCIVSFFKWVEKHWHVHLHPKI